MADPQGPQRGEVRPGVWRFLLLLCVLAAGFRIPALASDQGTCPPPPAGQMPKCGTPHSLSQQVDRPRMKIYVPSISERPDIYNKLSCLSGKAGQKWSQACPAVEGTARIPEIEVVRGVRPAGQEKDLELVYLPGQVNGHAEWAPDSNTIAFNSTYSWDCDAQNQNPTAEQQLFIDIASHEIGHAMGLCHDTCGGAAGPSVMLPFLDPGTSKGIHSEHCAAIKKVNYCNNGQCDLASVNACDDSPTGPCRFYDGFPNYLDLCRAMALPIACGQSTPPSSELCFHITEGRIGRRWTTRTTFNPRTRQYVEEAVLEIDDQTHSYIHCVDIGWPKTAGPGPGVAEGQLEGEGPIFFIRSRYATSVSGSMPVSGVLRDDLFGLGQLAFWLDGQPTQLQGLQTGLHDPHTCSEDPSVDCDANSGWKGFLDTSGVPNGFHTLTVAGANFRPGDPIPNIDTVSFFVDHDPGCSETTPPVVSLTAPASGSTVSGGVAVTASASDASGIEKVQFYVDGVRRHVDRAAPWVFNWDSGTVDDGSHTLGVRAVDLCGNGAWGANVPITVANSQPVTLTFTPTDDTWINQDEPDRVFGIYNFMRVRTHFGGNGRIAFLKFQVTGVTGPITSAKLRLRTQDRPISEFGVYRITSNAWSEGNLTWNNAPLTHDWFSGEYNGWPADTWRDFDVTGALSGDGVITLGLASGQNIGLMDIWSKESNIYVPVLEVTFVPGS